MGTLTDLAAEYTARKAEPEFWLTVHTIDEQGLSNGGDLYVVTGDLTMRQAGGEPVRVAEEITVVLDHIDYEGDRWDPFEGRELALDEIVDGIPLRLTRVHPDEVSTVGRGWAESTS